MLLAQIISEDIFNLNVHADHNHTQNKKEWDTEAKSLTAGLFLRKKCYLHSIDKAGFPLKPFCKTKS